MHVAAAALSPLQDTAPDWPPVTLAEAMRALLRDDAPAADAALVRAVACDQSLTRASEQIEELVAAAVRNDCRRIEK